MRTRIIVSSAICLVLAGRPATAQDEHQDACRLRPASDTSSPWKFACDGALFAVFNHQGGARGGDEFKSTNWFMGTASRKVPTGQLTLTGMVSLEPATATARGYRELFQVGEDYRGQALVDRQHPHDLLMQAAVVWRIPLDERTGFTIAAAPIGEAALGPVAYIHRASAVENPVAPLAHHKLDSTHIAMGVITAAVDQGPWVFETSLFHGTEPDDNRWDLLDGGALDSWSARGWYQPTRDWLFQVSHGFLKHPERFEPGDLRRTTASASWTKQRSDGFTAATVAFGRNDTDDGASNGFLAEATNRTGRVNAYGRLESLQVETGLFQPTPLLAGVGDKPRGVVTAFTVGALRELPKWRDFEFGLGADLTMYGVPSALRPSHGDHPFSFHAFLRIRPPAGHMGRMWNMTMAQAGKGM